MLTTTYFIPLKKEQYSVKTLVFKQRVEADGGQVESLTAVEEAYGKLAEWNVYTTVGHWSSPRFGYRINSSGNIDKRYCLFGNDAYTEGTAGWKLLPGTNGKAPQMETTKGAYNQRMIIPALVWRDRTITTYTVVYAYRFTYPNGGYQFSPILEHSDDFNSAAGFLLGTEQGPMIMGTSSPYTLVNTPVFGETNKMIGVGMRVDPSKAAPPYVYGYYNAEELTYSRYSFGTPPQANGGYAVTPAFLGTRGNTEQYYWIGTINDVFYVNALLGNEAIAWLDGLRARY